MEQFEVHPLFGDDAVHWYTPTNATLWMALAVIAVSLLMIYGSRGRALVPSRGAVDRRDRSTASATR